VTPEQFREQIAGIEAWANLCAVKYKPSLYDDHPGCGEPGHAYNAVKQMAYDQRYAREIAAIRLAMEHLSECVEARYYGVDLPRIDSGDSELDEAAAGLIGSSPFSHIAKD
jgi:hypothetical protein